MPIVRTTMGLQYFHELDDETGWTFLRSYPQGASHGITGDKVSGSAALYINLSWPVEFWNSASFEGGAGAGIVRIWHKASGTGPSWALHPIPGITLEGNGPCNYGWTRYQASGGCNIINYIVANGGNVNITTIVDRLVVASANTLTVAGLTPGQKVELYRSSDSTLLGTQTCAGGQTTVSFDISAEDYPEQMYMKIYGTNGTTLLETTNSYEMSGGDTWAWTAGAGTLSLTVDADIIYRSAAAGTPKICNIVANLKTLAGANYPGATIYFSTTLGEVDPASDVTDANGNAHTALTSTTHGIAVIKANWLGDATVPACSAYFTVHVFYEAEAPDTDKKFQVYIEGIEYVYVDGRYTQNELSTINEFEVEIPEWLSTITPHGYVNIYRLGAKEFHGILKRIKRSLSDSPRVGLSGPDVSVLLNDRVVDTKIYQSKTPQFIIDDLLDSFPCGITPGNLGSCATSLTITIETELLTKAIPRICDLVNWKYRVTLTRTLDFAESFSGGTTSAAFTEGSDIFLIDRDINYSPIANYIRMRGDGIVSTKQDGTKIQEQGLHQAPAFNKSISDQATLDAACQALLDMKKVEEETIPFEAKDSYAPGTFGPEDYVTITSAMVGMSGIYQIRKIERNLTDPYLAKLDLVNRTKAYWELEEAYRRMTKDVSI